MPSPRTSPRFIATAVVVAAVVAALSACTPAPAPVTEREWLPSAWPDTVPLAAGDIVYTQNDRPGVLFVCVEIDDAQTAEDDAAKLFADAGWEQSREGDEGGVAYVKGDYEVFVKAAEDDNFGWGLCETVYLP
jgi:hypothetical protein